MTYDAAISTESIEAIWRMWRKRPGTILVPGHDIPMVQEDGRLSWQAGRNHLRLDDLKTTTSFELVA